MIISHRHKFIFIKTTKTAGTSIEIALSKFCGAEDVITRITPEDEKLRSEAGYRGPQNFRLRGGGKFKNHDSASFIRAQVGESVWNSYFKFCVVRNPWDRAVSYYYWKTHELEERPCIDEFYEAERMLRLVRRGADLYRLDGRIAVDRVCIFERLQEELEETRTELGLGEPLELPRAKGHFRDRDVHYRDVLSQELVKRIATVFAQEVADFNFEY